MSITLIMSLTFSFQEELPAEKQVTIQEQTQNTNLSRSRPLSWKEFSEHKDIMKKLDISIKWYFT